MFGWVRPSYFSLSTVRVKNVLTDEVLYQVDDLLGDSPLVIESGVTPAGGTPYYFTVFGRNQQSGEISGTLTSSSFFTNPAPPNLTFTIAAPNYVNTISWATLTVDKLHVVVWAESKDLGDRNSYTIDSGSGTTSMTFSPDKFRFYEVAAFSSHEGLLSSVADNYILHSEVAFLKNCENESDCIVGIDEKIITYKIGNQNQVSFYPSTIFYFNRNVSFSFPVERSEKFQKRPRHEKNSNKRKSESV